MYLDAFSYLNHRIAQLIGHNLSYETVHCLSSNAFSPAIFTGEDCTSWWHHAHRDLCWDLVAGVLGLADEVLRPILMEMAAAADVLEQMAF